MINQQESGLKHTCIVVVGMSGTGKTTFVNTMTTQYQFINCINLDPAVKVLNYKPFIDIRQTHDYKKVMKEHKLGPNGAILTALNLFLAQPQIIVEKVEKIIKKAQKDHIFLVDIPGQIQVFTWSASSLILVEALATLMPVKIFYVIDSVRCQNPNTFLSNILFAQSIEQRMNKFQFVVFLNKADATNTDQLFLWLKKYHVFLESLNNESTYLSTLSKTIVINISYFYEKLKVEKISAKTGHGFQQIQKYIKSKMEKI